MTRGFRKGLVILVVAAFLPGLVGPRASFAKSDELVFGLTYEYNTLNPLYMSGADRLSIGALVFSRLFGATPEGELTAEVTSVVPTQQNGGISKDGLEITYHLRHYVKWADGVPLTSRDVVFTHEADVNPKNKSIETFGDKEIAAISAPDAYTVRVRLKRRFSPFIGEFNRPLIPAHLLDKFESLDKVDYNAMPVGSGPYRVVKWARGDRVDLVRNENYWGRKPSISKITLRTIPDQNTLALQLRSHDIDGTPIIDESREATLRSDPTLQLVKYYIPYFGLLIFNASDPRIGDVRIRRAIALALDRTSIMDKATNHFDDTSHPAKVLFGWAWDPSIKPLPYDQAGARKLLDAAGWKLGSDGIRTNGSQRLEFTLVLQAGHPFLTTEATQIAQALKDVGIGVELKAYVDNQFFLLTSEGPLWGGHFDMVLTRFVGSGDPDPDWLIGCDAAGKPNPYNFSHMCIPEIKPVLEDAVSTFDRERRKHDYRIVQRAMNEWLPVLLLSQSAVLSVAPKRLRGYAPSPYGASFWNVTDWSLGP